MCQQNKAQLKQLNAFKHPLNLIIEKPKDLYDGLNYLLQKPPTFIGKHIIGIPISAFLSTVNATLAGQTLFRLSSFNQLLQGVLNEWGLYLKSDKSNIGFRTDGKGWLSQSALNKWNYGVRKQKDSIWKYDTTDDEPDKLPLFKSWNSYFTRKFKDPMKSRPIAGGKTSNKIIVSCNDGALFRIRMGKIGVKKLDAYWIKDKIKINDEMIMFKDMPYSLKHIFNYKDLDKKYKLSDKFKNGSIFQTLLNPFNFHRWWTCVAGKVVFDPIVIPGYYYSKLTVPDYHGATVGSLPYLLHVNSRGICVIDTKNTDCNIGYVCMIPIGMAEVSTVIFNDNIKKGYNIKKGDELGYFQFGGSSFAIILENTKKYNKLIKFINADGDEFSNNPTPPTPTGGGTCINVGEQIAVVMDL